MVIKERHGSNKLENKLCCVPLHRQEGQRTPPEVSQASSRARGDRRNTVRVNDWELVGLLPSTFSSYIHTSTSANGLPSELLSALVNGSNHHDDTLLTSSSASQVSSISQLSWLPSSRPVSDGSLSTTDPSSSEAIHSSYTFVNSSTSDTSKPDKASVQTASPTNQESSTISSIYLETDDGKKFHWRKRKRKSNTPDITLCSYLWKRKRKSALPDNSSSSLYSYLCGYKKLRLYVLFVILLMCALIEGCLCSSMCLESSKVLPVFLRVDLNQSNVGPAEEGQCLRVTNEFVDGICNLPTTDRMKAIRKVNTNFCGLPLYNILNQTEKEVIEQCSPNYGCSSTLRYIQELDAKLSEIFCSFTDILDRMDCNDSYSYNGDCNSCREAYKQWLCSVHFEYYQGNVRIKPCIHVCHQVSRNCPFFRPYGDTHIGEPGFLCKDLTIHHDDAAAIYGQENCCFEPCQVFIMDEWIQGCPHLNVTSNCSSALTHNRATALPGLNLYLELCVIVTWIIRALSRYSCIGLT